MITDKTVFVQRLEKNADNVNKERYVAHSGFRNNLGIVSSAVRMNIQPAGAEFTALTDGIDGKIFRGFTFASGVVETMRLTVSGTSDQYIVRGREYFDYGIHKHSELTLSKDTR